MIERSHALATLCEALAENPVTALLGPRQCGKTTLARSLAATRSVAYFDLENERDLSRLSAPLLALESLSGTVILDEVQRKPELLETLRGLADRPEQEQSARFLLLGSASPRLVKGVSETLAGRVGFVDLFGFDLREVGAEDWRVLWLRGGFPRSFLSSSTRASYRWRGNFIRTFLERDIPQLGITIPAAALRRFWTMVAHYHAQVWNAAEFARSIGSAEATARRYLDILTGAYMVRQLQPWFENLKKRQVKAPKVYVRDPGLLHSLLTLETADALSGHPKLGASWEGFALEQVLAVADTPDVYFWGTHAGAEIDLLVFRDGKRYGFEMKHTSAPRTTKSMRIAMADLGLESVHIVHPGRDSYPLDTNIHALAIKDLVGNAWSTGMRERK